MARPGTKLSEIAQSGRKLREIIARLVTGKGIQPGPIGWCRLEIVTGTDEHGRTGAVSSAGHGIDHSGLADACFPVDRDQSAMSLERPSQLLEQQVLLSLPTYRRRLLVAAMDVDASGRVSRLCSDQLFQFALGEQMVRHSYRARKVRWANLRHMH